MKIILSFLFLFLIVIVQCSKSENKEQQDVQSSDNATNQSETCTPACEGKNCGDDGCGGNCGECLEGSICIEGLCCTPDCTNKECGDDGCGGKCGEDCSEGLECRHGKCRQPCTGEGFSPAFFNSSWKPIHETQDPENEIKGLFTFQEQTSEDYPLSKLSFEIKQYSTYFGVIGPGTYEITEGSACKLCIKFRENCNVEGCERIYFNSSGTVEILEYSQAKGSFSAVLRNVILREATFDKQGNVSYVKDGKTWCFDEYSMKSEKVEFDMPEPSCIAEGTGIYIDNNIGDFSLTNCLGKKHSLHEKCGQTKVMWIVLTAAWCPVCAEYLPQAYQTAQDYPSDITLWTVLGEDINKGSPSKAECLAYASKLKLDPEYTFYDNEWETVIKNIYPYDAQGVPFNYILDGKNMSYFWSDGVYGDAYANISTLLKSK
jgi:thiol-disulfide isomerase/thioredoxin